MTLTYRIAAGRALTAAEHDATIDHLADGANIAASLDAHLPGVGWRTNSTLVFDTVDQFRATAHSVQFWRDHFGAAGLVFVTTRVGHRCYQIDLEQTDVTPHQTAGGVYFTIISHLGQDAPVMRLEDWSETPTQAHAQEALDMIGAAGGGTLQAAKPLDLSTPLIVNYNLVKIQGMSVTGENTNPFQIRKVSGFVGEASIIAGDGVSPRNGFTIENVYFNGQNAPGDAVFLNRLNSARIINCMAQAHQGWGFRLDGCWLLNANFKSRFNGVDGGGGGGVLISCDARSTSQVNFISPTVNRNHNHDWLFKVNDADPNARPTDVKVVDGITELPANGETLTSLVEIEGCRICSLDGLNIAQAAGVNAPGLIIGGSSAVHDVEQLTLSRTYHQHNAALASHAITLGANVRDLRILNPEHQLGANSKFLDATAAPADAKIQVVGGMVDPSDYTDPAGVVSLFGDLAMQVGSRAGTAGGTVFVDPQRDATGVRIVTRDTAGVGRYLDLGAGPEERRADFIGLSPRLQFNATAPANPTDGELCYFDGASGRGLYLYNAALPGWMPLT